MTEETRKLVFLVQMQLDVYEMVQLSPSEPKMINSNGLSVSDNIYQTGISGYSGWTVQCERKHVLS